MHAFSSSVKVRLTIRNKRQSDNFLLHLVCFILLFSDHAKTFYIYLHYNFCRVVVCRLSVKALHTFKAVIAEILPEKLCLNVGEHL